MNIDWRYVLASLCAQIIGIVLGCAIGMVIVKLWGK